MSRARQVLILAAGQGCRMGASFDYLNKALLPLGGQAVISRIIALFERSFGANGESSCEFVVAVGHLAGQVEAYLALAHPEARIRCVRVNPYAGPGSGPGRSALACENAISGPFYLVCTDTLWTDDLALHSEDESWIGIAPVSRHATANYLNAEVRGDEVIALKDKQTVDPFSHQAFIGLAHLADHRAFFDALSSAPKGAQGEMQLREGFEPLLRAGHLRAARIAGWVDVGTEARYRKACAESDRRNPPVNLPKDDEVFSRVGPRVIKIFRDSEVASRRVLRHARLKEVIPQLVGAASGMYAYAYAPGETFYDAGDPFLFKRFLSWMESSVWIPPSAEATSDGVLSANFRERCLQFYRDKTFERVARYEKVDANGVADVISELRRIDWLALAPGIPSGFHGDLQFDNILWDSNEGSFRLIDWRQDFAGDLIWGDLRYDLAKLRAGIDLDFRELRAGRFESGRAGETPHADAYRHELDRMALSRGVQPSTIRLLAALIYLNMAPLHAGELGDFLWRYGRARLAAELQDQAACAVSTKISFV